MLRDRLVWGIMDKTVQRRLLQQVDLTFDRALETALAAEAADKVSCSLMPTTSNKDLPTLLGNLPVDNLPAGTRSTRPRQTKPQHRGGERQQGGGGPEKEECSRYGENTVKPTALSRALNVTRARGWVTLHVNAGRRVRVVMERHTMWIRGRHQFVNTLENTSSCTSLQVRLHLSTRPSTSTATHFSHWTQSLITASTVPTCGGFQGRVGRTSGNDSKDSHRWKHSSPIRETSPSAFCDTGKSQRRVGATTGPGNLATCAVL